MLLFLCDSDVALLFFLHPLHFVSAVFLCSGQYLWQSSTHSTSANFQSTGAFILYLSLFLLCGSHSCRVGKSIKLYAKEIYVELKNWTEWVRFNVYYIFSSSFVFHFFTVWLLRRLNAVRIHKWTSWWTWWRDREWIYLYLCELVYFCFGRFSSCVAVHADWGHYTATLMVSGRLKLKNYTRLLRARCDRCCSLALLWNLINAYNIIIIVIVIILRWFVPHSRLSNVGVWAIECVYSVFMLILIANTS